jgi:predicted RNase H-like nuclease (RuvC/YqgF family)
MKNPLFAILLGLILCQCNRVDDIAAIDELQVRTKSIQARSTAARLEAIELRAELVKVTDSNAEISTVNAELDKSLRLRRSEMGALEQRFAEARKTVGRSEHQFSAGQKIESLNLEGQNYRGIHVSSYEGGTLSFRHNLGFATVDITKIIAESDPKNWKAPPLRLAPMRIIAMPESAANIAADMAAQRPKSQKSTAASRGVPRALSKQSNLPTWYRPIGSNFSVKPSK